jgi:hypothetical protein
MARARVVVLGEESDVELFVMSRIRIKVLLDIPRLEDYRVLGLSKAAHPTTFLIGVNRIKSFYLFKAY